MISAALARACLGLSLWGGGVILPTAAAAAAQPDSTRRMIALIDEIYRATDIRKNPYRSEERVAMFEAQIAAGAPPEALFNLKTQLGTEFLKCGKPEEALRVFEDAERMILEKKMTIRPFMLPYVLSMQGVSHLRIGEQENCLHHHNAESCLFPIAGGGVHALPKGSRGAVAVFSRLLEKYPGDLSARWLLNIAYMTLGEYPEAVPQRWRIDPARLASEYDIGRFPDVAGKLGLDVNDLAGGVVMEDFDRDGLLDLMVSGWGFRFSQLRLFRNQGDGTFVERTDEAGLTGLLSGLNLIHGDYNNDGLADVLVLRGAWMGTQGRFPNSLLRNNGDFTFTDVTEETGLLSFHPTQAAAWFDYDGDGWLDLFIGNESGANDPHPCELFRNNGNGTFTECAASNGVAIEGFIKGVSAGDYNNDGRPDLFLSNRDGPRHLLRNDGPAPGRSGAWRFTDVTEAAGIGAPWASFPCWFFDYDNDGWLDLFVSGYALQDVGDVAGDVLGLPNAGERACLYRNRGDGTFADVSKELGVSRVLVTMGSNFGDLDNDGWLDFYLGTGLPEFSVLVPSRMFRNDAGRRFQDVTTSGGFGQLQKGHGIAFGDLDNDGDQDVYSVVGGAFDADRYHNQLFANPGHGARWVKLELEGTKSNRLAIGARVKVVVETRDGGVRTIHRTVGSGGSFGASPLRLEIGLGDTRKILRAEVFWPASGLTQVFSALALDRCYQLRESDPVAVPRELVAFALPTPSSPDRPHGDPHAGHALHAGHASGASGAAAPHAHRQTK